MPVRSLHSSVLKWPDTATVDRAAREWARSMAETRPQVLRVGYFGSYARGDWGVGSDLDIVVIVTHAVLTAVIRARDWDTSGLPVPADVLVYTPKELEELPSHRLRAELETNTVWVFQRMPGAP